MLSRLELTDFKSFARTEFPLAGFSLLVGANAGGKSNVREALRVLHAIGRGYTLAEALGEKWADGGVKVWNGVRGGAAGVPRHGQDSFTIDALIDDVYRYRLTIGVDEAGTPEVFEERLTELGDAARLIFDAYRYPGTNSQELLKISVPAKGLGGGGSSLTGDVSPERPALSRPEVRHVLRPEDGAVAERVLQTFADMRFLDLDPDAARTASPRGITQLGDRGENLSSVLEHITKDEQRREVLLSWVRALTPMDATDIEFTKDLNNKVMAVLVEVDEHRTPLVSASDGTVRFLAIAALLLGVEDPGLVFIEEIENGIHPSRVDLLLDLIGSSVESGRTQVIATSHSAQLLAEVYRSERGTPLLVARDDEGSRVIDVRSTPAFAEVLDEDDPEELMSTGWFETTVEFTAPDDRGNPGGQR